MVEAFTMLTTVVVGFFIGLNLDKWLDSSPLFTILLTFLGIASSIYSTIKRSKK